MDFARDMVTVRYGHLFILFIPAIELCLRSCCLPLLSHPHVYMYLGMNYILLQQVTNVLFVYL
jgi:predicted tellurium resistance membrane protein TerC